MKDSIFMKLSSLNLAYHHYTLKAWFYMSEYYTQELSCVGKFCVLHIIFACILTEKFHSGALTLVLFTVLTRHKSFMIVTRYAKTQNFSHRKFPTYGIKLGKDENWDL